jgi:hypothetical protein
MDLVLVAARAVFLPLDALGMEPLVLRREVVAVLTLVARENDFVSWHVLREKREAASRKRDCGVVPASLFLLPSSLVNL